MATQGLIVAVAIREDRVRKRFLDELNAAHRNPELFAPWPAGDVELRTFATLDDLAAGLNDHFAHLPNGSGMIVSDMLVSDGEFDHQAKDRIDPHFHHPVVTLAITANGRRVPDIDRVVSRTVDRAALAETLKLLVARLCYMLPPVARRYPNPFQMRQIDGEFELSRYYRLRHQVYTIMGYLSEKKERVATRLEVDGCDGNAIHLGAFEQCDGYETLVGTARVLLAEAAESKWAAWTRNLLKADRPLQVLVRNETLPLGLPVFHSQKLNDHLQEAFQKGLRCAEISRVIVAHEFRGAGLGRGLVAEGIREAQQGGVDRLYLECLRLHEPFYAKLGFRTIPGALGQVINVRKSMIAMLMELSHSGAAVPVTN